jgi:anti-anti-sigma factor
VPDLLPTTEAPAATAVERPTFECTRFAGADAAWVCARGELDMPAASVLDRVLDEAQTRSRLVVLELADLTFMDSAGVHCVVAASGYARIAGHRLLVLHASRQVRRLFDITATAHEVEFYELRGVG